MRALVQRLELRSQSFLAVLAGISLLVSGVLNPSSYADSEVCAVKAKAPCGCQKQQAMRTERREGYKIDDQQRKQLCSLVICDKTLVGRVDRRFPSSFKVLSIETLSMPGVGQPGADLPPKQRVLITQPSIEAIAQVRRTLKTKTGGVFTLNELTAPCIRGCVCPATPTSTQALPKRSTFSYDTVMTFTDAQGRARLQKVRVTVKARFSRLQRKTTHCAPAA